MTITSYKDFIQAALSQSEPQRLLFVFTKAELPEGHTDKQNHEFEQGQGGALAPVLCVDKTPDEAQSFDVLVTESKHTGIHWDVVFISTMNGRAGVAPNSDEAAQPLRMMMNRINEGQISDFLALTRSGELVELSPA